MGSWRHQMESRQQGAATIEGVDDAAALGPLMHEFLLERLRKVQYRRVALAHALAADNRLEPTQVPALRVTGVERIGKPAVGRAGAGKVGSAVVTALAGVPGTLSGALMLTGGVSPVAEGGNEEAHGHQGDVEPGRDVVELVRYVRELSQWHGRKYP